MYVCTPGIQESLPTMNFGVRVSQLLVRPTEGLGSKKNPGIGHFELSKDFFSRSEEQDVVTEIYK
jgi:hypothetical protein